LADVFTRDPFDRERYGRELASEILGAYTETPSDRIVDLFAEQTGYATPKVEVRAAVFDESDRILMVRETIDDGRWTLPGGFADVNTTPAENTVREVREESGYEVAVTKLAAVWDKTRQGHPPGVFSSFKMFFVCELIGGVPATSIETSEVSWFAETNVPTDLSEGRVLPNQSSACLNNEGNQRCQRTSIEYCQGRYRRPLTSLVIEGHTVAGRPEIAAYEARCKAERVIDGSDHHLSGASCRPT
jgi:ADP-ribose pyrophosphatase YjhB (NUDIX family)